MTTSTGLISLSIHEPLTFETEIVLHPDLFQSSAPEVGTNAAANRLTHSKDPTRLSTVPSSDSSTQRRLQEGDYIEIQVWDVVRENSPSSGGTAEKRRSSPPTATVPFSAQSSTSSVPPPSPNVKETLLEAASSLQRNNLEELDGLQILDSSTTTVSSGDPTHSLQATTPDEITPLASPSGGADYAEQAFPKIIGQELPPVFPRSRTNTADGMLLRVKPPMLTRRTPSAEPTSTKRPQPPTTSLPRARHFRDLSDVTIDTALYDNKSGTALDDGQALELPLRAGEDPTEEEESSWISSTHTLRLSFVMKVTEQSLTLMKSTARMQVSLLRSVADLYDLSSFDMISVRRIEDATALAVCAADFVLLTIKDQFISRGDMHFFQTSLLGTWVYEGKRLTDSVRGIQAHAREIRHDGAAVPTGLITEQTKITYRSRSARFIWLVELSSEMWEYTSPYERDREESLCETYFDKWIGFVHQVFAKWKEMEATHSLTVVYFSRTFVGMSPFVVKSSGSPHHRQRDVYGRAYEDHFRIVMENVTADWESHIVRLKETFVNYPQEVGWNLLTGPDSRRPSSAIQGNVLEAINVTLNLLQFHYLDRDLHRTGNSIVLVSAGNGVFEVDKGLASITYERMMVNGIGSDMVSLALPPLHTAPFFLYVNDFQGVETDGVNFGDLYYEVPHWMHLSFVSYDSEDKPGGLKRKGTGKHKSTNVRDIDGRPVLANGFLMPSIVDTTLGADGSSPLAKPAPNHPLSPMKKDQPKSKEKPLVSGREYIDILEACRPRHSGSLPSALEAVIRLFNGRHDVKIHETVEHADDPPELPEWGSLEFESSSDSPFRSRRVVALGAAPKLEVSPCVEATPYPAHADDLDKLKHSERSSAASSYTSQYSGAGVGVSYDRPFLATRASPTLTGIQVQRSVSHEVLHADKDDDDEEGMLSEASTPTSSALGIGGDSLDSESVRGRKKQGGQYKQKLQKLFCEFDSNYFAAKSPRLMPVADPAVNLSRHLSEYVSESTMSSTGSNLLSQPQRMQPRTGAPTGSGIGAALTQYRSTSGGGGGAFPELHEGPLSVPRMTSAPRLAGTTLSNLSQIAEMGGHGISPLLLPPVAMSSGEGQDLFRGAQSYRRTIEHRLIHPGELSRTGGESLGRLGSRNTMSAALSRSPPTSGGSPVLSSSVRTGRQAQVVGQKRVEDSRKRSRSRARRKKAFNPFRQQDEDAVLAKKSHNRRRWSHVFPLGEVEFKRHAGPSWKSLTSPAILPLFIDYFPSQREIDHSFSVSMHSVTLSEFENSLYSSNKDFLMEMVRQRLTQDFQLVPPSYVNASNFRRESELRDGLSSRSRITSGGPDEHGGEVTRQFLSMGHRLHVLTYDTVRDIVEVTKYDAHSTTSSESVKYEYECYCEETRLYSKVVQTFAKYNDPYNWSKVDRIICGDEDREMREGMRFKRVMFAVIPPRFGNLDQEKEYIAKFGRLLEYLNKLRDKVDSVDPLNVKIVSSENKGKNASGPIESIPGVAGSSMQRFYIRLRKGKWDPMEWLEVVVDTTFDTSWSYRILFHWLVASSGKVETQVQLLQRRCAQYGLTLVQFPQISVSKSVYLGPFKAPAVFAIRDKSKVPLLDAELFTLDYVYDGVFYTDAHAVKACLPDGDNFDFGQRWSRPAAGRQFVHRSGTLFVRILTDSNGMAIVVALGNYLYMITSKDPQLRVIADRVFRELSDTIEALPRATAKLSIPPLALDLDVAHEPAPETVAEEQPKATSPVVHGTETVGETVPASSPSPEEIIVAPVNINASPSAPPTPENVVTTSQDAPVSAEAEPTS